MKAAMAPIETFIHAVRGEKVIFSTDLANVYGVSTRVLNQTIKRNRSRFPTDFCFQLSAEEWANLRSQFVISNYGSRYRPWVFTEHGAVMAANILKSDNAVQMSIFVVRAFIKMRQTLGVSASLTQKLEKLETEITDRLDSHEKAIVELMQHFFRILNPESPQETSEAEKREMGFHVKNKASAINPKTKRAQ